MKGTRKGKRRWDRKYLIQLASEIASVANSTEGNDPKWTVVVTMMVNIYRDEYGKKQTITNYVPEETNNG